MTIVVYVGNTAPSVEDTLQQVLSSGALGPIDLTTATVRFKMRSLWSDVLLIDSPAVIVNAPAGMVRYDWTLANTTTAIDSQPGGYVAWWEMNFTGTLLDSPQFDVLFQDHSRMRQVGPCTNWCLTQDVTACYSAIPASACLSSAVKMASELLFEISGRSFPGYCQSTVRPCADGHGQCGQILSRGHIVSWGGMRGWRGSDDEPCGCGSWLQKVTLAGTPQAVIQVMIDGIVIPEASYRLDPDGTLFRTDGGAWPICQNMAAAGNAPGAFQIKYAHGYQPPELGRKAAVQLASEFYKACSNQACKLPAGVTKIVRQGIEITRAANLFREGATGLAMVDSFIHAYGCGDQGTIVLTPEVINRARRTA